MKLRSAAPWPITDAESYGRSRPSFWSRACSGVFSIAVRIPQVVKAIPASIRKSNCSSKIRWSSWSNPTIIPATIKRLCDWISRMLSRSGRCAFCRFFVSIRLSTRGDSIPTKMLVKLAARRSSRSRGRSATVSDERDRALAGEIATGTLRWQGAFDHVIAAFAARPAAQAGSRRSSTSSG